MSIEKVIIKNFKSLKYVDLNFEIEKHRIHCFLGKNGSGKSNFLDALKYFFDVMNNKSLVKDVIDNQNPYTQSMEIEIVFNFTDLLSLKNNNFVITKYIKHINNITDESKKVSIKLTQHKNRIVKWTPNDKNLLDIIRKVFPVYFIDTRFIDLLNWNYLWDVISDLSKTNLNIGKEEYNKKLDDLLKESFGDKYLKSLNSIKETLMEEQIYVNEHDYTNSYKSILKARLGGDEFTQEGNRLSYFSDGINSYNYLMSFLRIIPRLSEISWKNPIIIIDELEIGLHPQYINSLIDNLEIYDRKCMNLLISTHSPIVISRIFRKEVNISIHRVYNKNLYTYIEKMNQVIEQENKSLITMNEASCYFDDAIFFVEGLSEMQLFHNKNLMNLFPSLNKVSIYPFDSNNSVLKFMSPEITNFSIPYLLMVDMDKILVSSKVTKEEPDYKFRFKPNKDKLINPLGNKKLINKEKYLFYSEKDKKEKKNRRYYLSMKLLKRLDDTIFPIDEKKLYVNNNEYNELMTEVRNYCLEYNVLPLRNTIEGAIITKDNVDKVISWINSQGILELDKLEELLEKDKEWSQGNDLEYRAIILRLIYSGKIDKLIKLDKCVNQDIIDKEHAKKIKMLRKKAGKKTDGWIIEFINYYFENYIDKESNQIKKKEMFKTDFPELNIVLNNIKNMVEYKR